MKIHVDTDFAGDTDDACAVGLLLGSRDVDLTAATTVADPDGRRAGYLDYFLRLGGRRVPVATGSGASLTTGGVMGGLPDHAAYWGDAVVRPLPASPTHALDLLEGSVADGATLVAIGPYTNLAALERAKPGALRGTSVVVMGGWIAPPRAGLPEWGPEMDWNVQCDIDAAETVFESAGQLTLVLLAPTLDAHVRVGDLDRLRASGPIGRLLARQAAAHASEHDMIALGGAHPGLPDDLLNFQFDVVACAAALGASVVTLEQLRLAPRREGGVLRFEQNPRGRSVPVVTAVDGDRLNALWLQAIERADSPAAPS